MRWRSGGSVASKGKWEVQVSSSPLTSDLGESTSQSSDHDEAMMQHASWAWEVLDGLRRRGVGERMWTGWLSASSAVAPPEELLVLDLK